MGQYNSHRSLLSCEIYILKLTFFVGDTEGELVGLADGEVDGPLEGDRVGLLDGECVGLDEGDRLGALVGLIEGE